MASITSFFTAAFITLFPLGLPKAPPPPREAAKALNACATIDTKTGQCVTWLVLDAGP